MTFAQGYAPYGSVATTSGSGATTYGFTNEYQNSSYHETPTVTPPPDTFLKLIDPNGGERIEYQSVYGIDWGSQGVEQVQIHLLYSYICEGCLDYWFATPITSLIENTGQYNWIVRVDFPASDKVYKIRIDGFDINGNLIGVRDESNAPFYIFVPY